MNTTTLEPSRLPATEPDESTPDTGERKPLNLPLNLERINELPEEMRDDATWFLQYAIANNFDKKRCEQELEYSWPNIWKFYHNRYEGNLANFHRSIKSYRKLRSSRDRIQWAKFVHNSNSRLIFNALTYALASNTIALILGETGLSKSMSLPVFRDENNHGRTVLVEAPVICTVRTVLETICAGVGVGKAHKNTAKMFDAACKALSPNRILIIDEAHFLFPNPNASEKPLEIVRRIHDKTRCAVALVASFRFGNDLKEARYHFEQLLGRASTPTVLNDEFTAEEIDPILEQYMPRAAITATVKVKGVDLTISKIALAIANNALTEHPGRLRRLVEILKFTSDRHSGQKITQHHFMETLSHLDTLRGSRKARLR